MEQEQIGKLAEDALDLIAPSAEDARARAPPRWRSAEARAGADDMRELRPSETTQLIAGHAAELSSEARVELLGDVLSTAATPDERRRLAEQEVYGLPSAARQAMLAEIIGTLVEDDRRELLIMLEGDAERAAAVDVKQSDGATRCSGRRTRLLARRIVHRARVALSARPRGHRLDQRRQRARPGRVFLRSLRLHARGRRVPQPLGQAATWDKSLIYDVATASCDISACGL